MPTFNVQKAKQAGWDDQKIQTYLSKHPDIQASDVPSTQPGQPKYASALDRAVLSFGDAQGREQYLQKRGIAPENVNQPGFDAGDITSKAGGLLPAALGYGGASLGALAGAPTGPGALATASAGGLAGGIAGEGLRQGIGQALGVQANPGGMEQAKDIGVEGITNAIAPGLGKLTAKVGARYLTKQPEKLFRRALKLSRSSIQAMEKKGIKVKDLIDLGKFGSLDSLANKADDIVKETQGLKQVLVDKADDVVNVQPFIQKLNQAADEALQVGDQARANALNKFRDAYDLQISKATQGTYQMTVKAAEQARKKVSKALGNKFLGDAAVKEGQRTVQGIYKEAIEGAIPEVAALNNRIRTAMELKNLAQAAEKSGASVLSKATSVIATMIGGYGGYQLGGPGAVTPAILGTLAATMTAQSPLARTLRAQGIRAVGNVAKKVAPVAKPVGNILLRQFLSQ